MRIFLMISVSWMGFLLFSPQTAVAQTDPFDGSYIIREGSGDELIGSNSGVITLMKYFRSGIISPHDSLVTMLTYPLTSYKYPVSLLGADLDGDEVSELAAAARSANENTISLVVLKADPNLLGIIGQASWADTSRLTLSNPPPLPNESVFLDSPAPKLVAGNFTGNGTKDLFLGYWAQVGIAGSGLMLTLYQVDSALHCSPLDDIADQDLDLPPPLFDGEEALMQVFSLIPCDVDGDGTDELFAVVRERDDSTRWHLAASVYSFDPIGGTIERTMHEVVYAPSDSVSQLRELQATAGHLLSGMSEQVILAFTTKCSKRDQSSFMQIIRLDSTFVITSQLCNSDSTGTLQCVRDVNGDGRDELLCARDGVVVYGYDTADDLTLFGTIGPPLLYPSVRCGNVEGDSIGEVIPNIIITRYGTDWRWYQDIYHLRIAPFGFIEDAELVSSLRCDYASHIQWADFDGDIRLGAPRHSRITAILQPLVILNAPPIHFDVFNDSCFDVCKSYNQNVGQFIASYIKQSSQMTEVQTTINSDWGISSTLSTSHSFFGVSVKSHLTTSYGEKFSKVQGSSQKVTVGISVDAKDDDRIYATVLDYDVWEYPVFGSHAYKGDVLAVVPALVENRWFPSKSWSGYSYTPSHEVGNVLSYREYPMLSDNPDLDEKIKGDYSNSFVLDANSSYGWSLLFDDFQSSSVTREKEFSMDWGASIGGWGVSLSINGHYSREEINTQRTEVSNGLDLLVHLDGVDMGIGEVGYTVTPYSYWAKNGALVIDYAVRPELAQPGGTSTWWQVRYGGLADPSFILPWKFDPEKGYTLQDSVKRQQTKDISFYPSDPHAGDLVTITARVRNFSLMQTPGPIGVRFYLGDPDNGGVPIVGVEDQVTAYTPMPVQARGTQTAQLTWILPQDIGAYPRVYGVIDPENALAEIHENNNKGWTILGKSTTDVEEDVASDVPRVFGLEQNYPNPFNPSTVVIYRVAAARMIDVRVYDILGREVAVLANEVKPAGRYTVIWNAANMPSGVYFCRLTAGEFSQTRKVMLLR